MSDIISKYFNDRPDANDYAKINEFYPPAHLDRINEVEKTLSIKFPQDYIGFLCITNGYNGKVGQSYSIF